MDKDTEVDEGPDRTNGKKPFPWKIIILVGAGLAVAIFILRSNSTKSNQQQQQQAGTSDSQAGDNSGLAGYTGLTEFDLLNAIQDLTLKINNMSGPSTVVPSPVTNNTWWPWPTGVLPHIGPPLPPYWQPRPTGPPVSFPPGSGPYPPGVLPALHPPPSWSPTTPPVVIQVPPATALT